MARKKKADTKKPILGHYGDKPVHQKGDIIWIDFENLPGNVLGKVYLIDDGVYEPCNARLVYIAEKSKFIVE